MSQAGPGRLPEIGPRRSPERATLRPGGYSTVDRGAYVDAPGAARHGRARRSR
ncbi:predicted protein [Streptomyces sp. AA4]|nr:predicted protein [Streptomyces sp. AA4]